MSLTTSFSAIQYSVQPRAGDTPSVMVHALVSDIINEPVPVDEVLRIRSHILENFSVDPESLVLRLAWHGVSRVFVIEFLLTPEEANRLVD